MSDKETLLAKEQKDLAATQAKAELKMTVLSALPNDLPLESAYASGYCAKVTLCLPPTVSLAEATAALPPVPCTYVLGSTWTVKPTAFLRNDDVGRKELAYPLSVVSPKGMASYLRWWSSVAGIPVEVHVRRAEGSAGSTEGWPGDLSRMQPTSHHYSTGATQLWVRRRLTSADLGLSPTPMSLWAAEWDAWAADHGLTPEQRPVLDVFQRTASVGEVREIPGKNEPASRWPLKFWEVFSDDTAQALQAFTQQQVEKIPACQQTAKDILPQAKAWFEAFFAQPYSFAKSDMSSLAYHFHKETRLPGTLNFASASEAAREIEVGFTVDKEHLRLRFPLDLSKPAFDWDSLIDYA